MESSQVIAGESKYIVPTYVRPEVVFSHGQGVYLYDSQGKRYLDFASGIAVMALGHGDELWLQAISEQAAKLIHVSNLYHTEPQVALAQSLVENSFADRVFFCNSGTEANEAAIKFARKYAGNRPEDSGQAKKSDIIAFSGSFHGRTMGALATTYQSHYREPFEPVMPGVRFASYNDLASAKEIIDEKVCAVIVEPVQGEGGVNPADPDFLQGLRSLCDEYDALLIFDEVQCGLGRSGFLWAHEEYGITPDIMTLAKPLAGGLPIGATLVKEAVSQLLKPGDHGSTFAGGPLVCTAAQVVFDRVNRPQFLSDVKQNGTYLANMLGDLATEKVVDVRGVGLLIGIEFEMPVAPLVNAARENGLLVITAGDKILRLCPPLIVTRQQIETAVQILNQSLATVEV
jgi:predicted acetylornithine/succinylornithine family transaminase